MTPELAAYRLVCSLLLGAVLGLYYGFLRPLGARHRTLADALFLAGVIPVWLLHSFSICLGDIRMGFFFGMLTGGFCWEATFGRWLRPLFFRVWRQSVFY